MLRRAHVDLSISQFRMHNFSAQIPSWSLLRAIDYPQLILLGTKISIDAVAIVVVAPPSVFLSLSLDSSLFY